MKILTIVDSLGNGGIQRVARNFAVAYREYGYESAICVLKKNSDMDQLPGTDVQVYYAENQDCMRQIVSFSPDILHLHRHGGKGKPVFNLVRKIKDKKKCLVFDLNSFAWPNFSKDDELVDCTFVLSKWCLWRYKSWNKLNRSQHIATFVPNMMIEDEFYPLSKNEINVFRNKLGIPESAFVLGRIGQPNEASWKIEYVDIFRNLASEIKDIYMVMVGPPKNITDAIRRIEEPEIKERIIIKERVDDDAYLRGIYNCMDLFVHMSRIGESFGNVNAEAMLCRTPVITLSTPQFHNTQIEVVQNGQGGVVVNNVKTMQEMIYKLYHNRVLSTKAAGRSRELIMERYSREAVMKRMKKIIGVFMSNADNTSRAEALERMDIPTKISRKAVQKELQGAYGSVELSVKLKAKIHQNPYLYYVYSHLKNK
ncbi:MAG: glycosyltransferase family 4 protein [Bacteroidia bacterium]